MVLWRLHYKLSLRDLPEMFAVRGIVFSYEVVRDWEAKLTLALAKDLRRRRHGKVGRSWYVDETCARALVLSLPRHRPERDPGRRAVQRAPWQRPRRSSTPLRRSPASRRTGCQFALNLSRMRALSLRLTAKLRRYPVRLAVCALAACLFALPASADVVAHIDNATQRMTVVVDGAAIHSWPVSTARTGYETPAGSYYVQRMECMWRSRKYNMAPMPHALFFEGGLAIHGTSAVGQLGRPASHGCVRLSPSNARRLFELVRQHGGAQVVITNGSPATYARLESSPAASSYQRAAAGAAYGYAQPFGFRAR